MSKHRHVEMPRSERDAVMLNVVEADEALYILLGFKDGKVVAVGACQQTSPKELVEILEQAKQTVMENSRGH